ncbi:unnamed protein product [Rotaria sordida]|uniref:Diacylglycerol kinase n=1 Tax=Rotaria sordida TaxID=392033 RepID=A0A819JUB9_9BILA|nr:unnamed protein product [Rotaria sordida]
MSTLPIDDNSQLDDFNTLMEENQSTGIDQHHREPTSRVLEHDLYRLDLKDSPKAVENVKEKRSNSLPTTLSDPSDPPSSPFNHQRLLVSYAGDDHDEQFYLLSSSTDVMVGGQPSSHCDQCSNIIVRPQWLSRSSESPTGFRARLPSHSINSDFELNSFPYTPVIVFINKRSGGQQGDKIYRELLRKLNPRQIFLLEDDATITHALNIYSSLPNIRLCVCGGDGSVNWILGHLAQTYPSRNNPPVSICPLGTGNDLSRVLAWGEQYDSKRLFHTLVQIPQAKVVALDRWEVQLEQLDESTLSSMTQQNRKNGFQIGCPLQLDFARANTWNLGSYIRLICDGRNLTDAIRDCHTLVVLNIPGYAAGTNPWGKSSSTSPVIFHSDQSSISQIASNSTDERSVSSVNVFDSLADIHEASKSATLNEDGIHQMASSSTATILTDCVERQDFGDQKIEVIGLSAVHMATIHMGFSGNRIAQCNQLRIEFCSPMTAQMDGEPFYLPASVAININHAGQVLVLKNQN